MGCTCVSKMNTTDFLLVFANQLAAKETPLGACSTCLLLSQHGWMMAYRDAFESVSGNMDLHCGSAGLHAHLAEFGIAVDCEDCVGRIADVIFIAGVLVAHANF